jgi:hypothetical protein
MAIRAAAQGAGLVRISERAAGKSTLVAVGRGLFRCDLKKVSKGSRFMVHRLLDVLMQDAWSLTAFVNSASRQG